MATDEAFRMEASRRFHDLAAAAGNERSPRVDRGDEDGTLQQSGSSRTL